MQVLCLVTMLRKRYKRCLVWVLLVCGIVYIWARHSTQDSGPGLRGLSVALAACPEHHNVAYIKMIKCGSETLTSMLHRFALVRGLSTVLPQGNRLYLGWPYPIDRTFYRPSAHFNMLADHTVYSPGLVNLMPSDTVFITSLREPFSQFKSMFHYYNLAEIMGISSDDPLEEYFADQDRYEAVYKSPHPKKYCIPDGLSMSRNLMAFNLGFPTGFYGTPDMADNDTYINQWLDSLTEQFSLVIIVEYFDESLVLLRRLLCWSLRDILYLSRNVGQYTYKVGNRQHLVNKYKAWSRVDHVLYDRFTAILQARIRAGGSSLASEAKHFKATRERLQTFCAKKEDGLIIMESEWTEQFVLTKPFCDTLQLNLLDTLKAIYDQKTNFSRSEMPNKNY